MGANSGFEMPTTPAVQNLTIGKTEELAWIGRPTRATAVLQGNQKFGRVPAAVVVVAKSLAGLMEVSNCDRSNAAGLHMKFFTNRYVALCLMPTAITPGTCDQCCPNVPGAVWLKSGGGTRCGEGTFCSGCNRGISRKTKSQLRLANSFSCEEPCWSDLVCGQWTTCPSKCCDGGKYHTCIFGLCTCNK